MKRRVVLGRALAASALALAPWPLGCRRRSSPEEQVRDTIAALARAVEEKDIDRLRAAVSPRYRDAEGHDRPDVLSLLRVYLRRHPRIHLLTRVTAVELPGAGEAKAVVVVAMAGLPMKVLDDLPRLQADVHRFDLVLAEEPPREWKVTGAAWQEARPEDLF